MKSMGVRCPVGTEPGRRIRRPGWIAQGRCLEQGAAPVPYRGCLRVPSVDPTMCRTPLRSGVPPPGSRELASSVRRNALVANRGRNTSYPAPPARNVECPEMWSRLRKPSNDGHLHDNNSTLLGDLAAGPQAFQAAQQVCVAAPVSRAGISVQRRFGLPHRPASRSQVHRGSDAGCRDAGVTQPAADRVQASRPARNQRQQCASSAEDPVFGARQSAAWSKSKRAGPRWRVRTQLGLADATCLRYGGLFGRARVVTVTEGPDAGGAHEVFSGTTPHLRVRSARQRTSRRGRAGPHPLRPTASSR